MKHTLIIGGSSGLGLELARSIRECGEVIITGRRDPEVDGLDFRGLELSGSALEQGLDNFVADLPNIELLVYAAGFYQEGALADLRDDDVREMNDVGLLAPALLFQRVLKKQSELSGLIAITSTSQWTPRLLEPMYTAVKAGLGMLSNSLAEDPRIGKVMVVGPAGMQTRFWGKDGSDTGDMLNPAWVAKQTIEHWDDDFQYKFIKILRNPPRVEVTEAR